MDLAQKITVTDMETIAIRDFGIDSVTVRNLRLSRGEQKVLFNFDVLEKWRNKSVDNGREVCMGLSTANLSPTLGTYRVRP